jgi:hypothetical protein
LCIFENSSHAIRNDEPELRGCSSPQSALLIDEAEQNTRSPWPGLTP